MRLKVLLMAMLFVSGCEIGWATEEPIKVKGPDEKIWFIQRVATMVCSSPEPTTQPAVKPVFGPEWMPTYQRVAWNLFDAKGTFVAQYSPARLEELRQAGTITLLDKQPGVDK